MGESTPLATAADTAAARGEILRFFGDDTGAEDSTPPLPLAQLLAKLVAAEIAGCFVTLLLLLTWLDLLVLTAAAAARLLSVIEGASN